MHREASIAHSLPLFDQKITCVVEFNHDLVLVVAVVLAVFVRMLDKCSQPMHRMDHLDRDLLACRVEAKQRQRPCHWVVLLVVVAVVALLVVVAVVAMSVGTPISVPTPSCFVIVMAYEEMTVATSEARAAFSEVLAMQRHGKGRDKDVRREATRAEKPRMHKSVVAQAMQNT